MANCVEDLVILLQPIRRIGIGSTGTSRESGSAWHPRDLRLSSLPNFPAIADPEMAVAFDRFREKVKAAEWSWNPTTLPPSFNDTLRFQHTVMAVEAAAFHAERMRWHPGDYPPNVTSLIQHGIRTPADQFARILDHMRQFRDEIEGLFVDPRTTLVTPAAVGPAPTIETTGDPAFNSPWSYSGLPTVSLPFATTEMGLPLGIQLIGDRWCEGDLLSVAMMLEPTIAFERRPLSL